MKIRTKLIIGFVIVASLIWVTVSSARSTYEDIHVEVEMLGEHVVPAVVLLGEMDLAASEIKHQSMEYVLYGESGARQETLSIIENLKEMKLRHGELMKPMGMYIGEEAHAQLDPLSVHIDTFVSAIMETNDLKGQGESTDELLLRDKEIVDPAFIALDTGINEHKAHHLEALVEAEEAVHQARTNGERFLILISSLITLAAVAVAFLITRMITNPIRALHKGIEIIGEGHLDYKVGTPAKDEIGQLSRAFDQMTEDLKGTTTSIAKLNREITERKKVEEALRKSKEKYESLTNNIPDVIYSCLPDKDATMIYVSDRLGDWTGHYPDDFYRDAKIWINCIHPEDRDRATAGFTEAFSNNKELDIEYRVVHKGTGQVRYVRDHGTPIHDDDGKVIRYDGVFSNITERKQAEHDVAERVKELDCLYGISRIAERQGLTVAEVFQEVVKILPAGWQYPGIPCARITAGDGEFKTANYRETDWRQSSAIKVKGDVAGYVEVGYLEEKPALDEGPFLKEERLLIDAVAERLGIITERKLAEDKIKASLAEKEMLLKEVHHRVKNNMQVISSLLKLQSGSVKNKEDAALFEDSRDRIKSMALVYNKLYQSEDLAHVDFGEYVGELARNLAHSYKTVSGKVTTSVEGGDVSLGVDQAIPCGLVVNELITNSLKYAFPKGRDGEIRVSLAENEGEVELTVSDDGVGIPTSLDLASSPTLGLRLVGNLVEQLGGKIELDRTAGARFRITFRKSQE